MRVKSDEFSAQKSRVNLLLQSRGLRTWLKGAASWVLFAFSISASAGTAEGLGWLMSQQNTDGGFGSTPTSLVAPVQSTAEVLKAYQALGQQAQSSYAPALNYLNADTEVNTEFLARKIVINAQGGADVSTLLNTLLTHQNSDGGFGDQPGYESSVLDTALALEALASANQATSQSASAAVGYLLYYQQASGVWADGENDPSVYLAALSMRALWPYRHVYLQVPAVLTQAQNFLLASRDASGSWGETFNTALALTALIPYLPDLTAVTDSINQLQAAQLANGSFDNDPYTTALALQALYLVSLPQTNPDYAQIKGRVIEAQTGLPLSGVTVTLAGAASRVAVTAGDGVFEFLNLPAGSYSINITLSNYAPLATATTARFGQTIDLGALLLTKATGASTGTIKGIVTDAATGSPLADAPVIVDGIGMDWPVATDSQGSYQIANVPATSVTVMVSKSGYGQVSGSGKVPAGGVFVFSPTLVPGGASTAAVQGKVTSAATGLPLPGVQIAATSAAVFAYTNDNGEYRLEGLIPGRVTLTASLAGYDPVSVQTLVFKGSTLAFSPKLYEQGTTPPEANTAGVKGVVLDAGTNKPLAGVSVIGNFEFAAYTTSTDSEGRFLLSGVSGYEGGLQFVTPGYLPAVLTVSLTPLGILDVREVRLRREKVLELLADLVVTEVDRTGLQTDPNTLGVSGKIVAKVKNRGTANASGGFEAVAFLDLDRNGRYEAAVDQTLGRTEAPAQVVVDGLADLELTISGRLLFRDMPVLVWADSTETVLELSETNNVGSSASACTISPSRGQFVTDPNDTRNWLGASVGTFAKLYFGADTFDNRKKVIGKQLLVDGIFDPTGVAAATLFSPGGAGGCLGLSTGSYFNYVCLTQGNVADHANAIDNLWFQTSGTVGQTVFDLGFDATKVAVFNTIDHGPLPQEAIESTVYLSNDLVTWAQGVVERVWLHGYRYDQSYDGFVYVVGTPGGETFRYASVIHGGPGALISDGDNEINGLVGLREDIAQGIPDLSASLLRLTDNGLGVSPSVTLRVGNAGAATAGPALVAFYQGDPASGGKLLGSVNVTALSPGEYRDLRLDNVTLVGGADLYAVVDPQNKVSECNETNNTVSAPATASTLLGRIAVSTDALAYGAYNPVQITATATNLGALPAIFSVALRIEDSNGFTVSDLAARSIGTLAGGASQAVADTWNTGTTLAGTYRVRATLLGASGEVLHEATTSFEIKHPEGAGPAVMLRLTTDRPVYYTTDRANIQSLIGNVTANTIVENAVIRITITDPAGQVLLQRDGALGQLLPGSVRDMVLPYAFQGAAVAVYRVRGEVLDASSVVLASAETRYEVRFDLDKALAGRVEAAAATLEAGATQACTYKLTNTGTVAVASLDVRYALANMDTQQWIQEEAKTLGLQAGEQNTYVRGFATGGLTSGHYACVLLAQVNGAMKTLAYAPFTLTEPPVRINAALNLGPKGRLLILLDAPRAGALEDSPAERAAQDANPDRDPHGPDAAPRLSAQRTFLETLLKKGGWSYTITESADAFTRELRTGGYAAYALFAEHEKLTEDAQKELREAVYRGEGLIVAGAHDSRHDKLWEALGLTYKGETAHAEAASLTGLELTGEIALLAGDSILRVARTTAQSLAIYRLAPNTNACEGDSTPAKNLTGCVAILDAVTLNAHGQGKSLFAGFDLLAAATQAGEGSLAAQLLLKALGAVPPAALDTAVERVVPVELVLSNEGIATPVKAILTLPEGVSLIEAPNATVQGNTLTWETTLAVAEEKRLTAYLRLPANPGSVTIGARVLAPKGGVETLIATANLNLTVAPAPDLAPIVANLESLSSADRTLTPAVQHLRQAEADISAKRSDLALHSALLAADVLASRGSSDTAPVRGELALWIRWLEVQLP